MSIFVLPTYRYESLPILQSLKRKIRAYEPEPKHYNIWYIYIYINAIVEYCRSKRQNIDTFCKI